MSRLLLYRGISLKKYEGHCGFEYAVKLNIRLKDISYRCTKHMSAYLVTFDHLDGTLSNVTSIFDWKISSIYTYLLELNMIDRLHALYLKLDKLNGIILDRDNAKKMLFYVKNMEKIYGKILTIYS